MKILIGLKFDMTRPAGVWICELGFRGACTASWGAKEYLRTFLFYNLSTELLSELRLRSSHYSEGS